MLDLLRNVKQQEASYSCGNLNLRDPGFVKGLTGFGNRQLQQVSKEISLKLSPSSKSSPFVFKWLVLLFAKLRHDLSHDILKDLFGYHNKGDVSYALDRITDLLLEHFVPNHLGWDHLSREELCKYHTSRLASALFETENPILVADGTYIYVERGKDHGKNILHGT